MPHGRARSCTTSQVEKCFEGPETAVIWLFLQEGIANWKGAWWDLAPECNLFGLGCPETPPFKVPSSGTASLHLPDLQNG